MPRPRATPDWRNASGLRGAGWILSQSMAPLTADQLRTRGRIEGLIRLAAPALDLVLAVGERISKLVEPEDHEYYPPRSRTASEPAPSRAADGPEPRH